MHTTPQKRKRWLSATMSIAAMAFACTTLHAQTINTFAGNGTAGYSGDGGPATGAQINQVSGLTTDATGNVYMGDGNGFVRKVNTSGVISTFATSVGFALCSDAAGNVYSADPFSHIAQIINSGGVVNLLAGNGTFGYSGDGGPATAAQMESPEGIAVDATGNVYIADAAANVIRIVNTSGIIKTFAGTGAIGYTGDGGPASAATFSRPVGLCFDAGGNLYIADANNHVVRKINTSGIISTFAGTGASGFSGDGGPAIAATFVLPTFVQADGSGNIYISDFNDNRVREVKTTGIINTVAGNGSPAYCCDGGPATLAGIRNPSQMAVDGSGNFYIAETNSYRVRIVTGLVPTVCSACDSLGNFWRLNGNNVGASNFLGSVNAADLVLKTNATERMRIDFKGNTGINTAPGSPSAVLDVNCSTGTWPSGLRFENLPTGHGNVLVVDANGYVYAANSIAYRQSQGNGNEQQDVTALTQQVTQLQQQINDLKSQLYASGSIANATGNTFSVSPNPNNGHFTASYSLATSANNIVIKITDANGKIIASQQTSGTSGSVAINLPSDMASGNFICSLIADGNIVSSQKVVLLAK